MCIIKSGMTFQHKIRPMSLYQHSLKRKNKAVLTVT